MKNISIKKFSVLSLPLFLLWPFGAFLIALGNIQKWYSAVVIIGFTVLFGYSFSFTDTSADSYRIAYYFSIFDFSSFSLLFQSYLEGNVADLYYLLMYGTAKSISSNPKVLYALAGLIFGVFMYLGLKVLADVKMGRNDLYFLLLSVFFFSLNPISNLNGFRFWTATWFFFYFLMRWRYYNNFFAVFFLLATPLIHFSYLFPTGLLVVFYLIQNLTTFNSLRKILMVVYILTFFFSFLLETDSINFEALSGYLDFNSYISYKVGVYSGEEVGEDMEERGKTLFHTVSFYFNLAIRLYFLFLMIKINRKASTIDDKPTKELLILALVLTSICNLFTIIPSGGRFSAIAYMVSILLIMRLSIRYKNFFSPIFFRNTVLLGLPIFSFNIAFTVLLLSIVLVSPLLWVGNVYLIIVEGIGFTFQQLF